MSVDKTNYPPQKKTTNGCGSWSGTCTHFKPSRGLVALSVVVVIVIAATFVVWTNDFIRVRLNKNIGLENNTLSYRMWEKPPVSPIMAVYIFNYTNANEFQKGIDKKLKVQEVGPYVYREHAEKVNVVFNPNGTVSYQQKTSFSYVPELSAGHRPRQEYITVPNIPLLSAMSVLKDSYVLAQLAFLAVSSGMETRQFTSVTAHDFFWGYDDTLFNLARTYGSFTQELPYKKFGILVQNGILRNRVTMYTGKEDVQMLGVISRFNGEERLHHWSGKDCNRIDGTDGSLFPPNLVKRNSTIHVFSGEICRRFPLEYSEDIIAHGRFPALRFRAPRDVFANPDVNPENACYCHPDTETCPPSGIFNASPCAFGAPVMISFPHFYLGDPSLLQTVEGLKPDPQKHYGYLDLHEELGVPLDGKSRFQLNMMVRSSSTLRQLANFKDGSILPIAWFDVMASIITAKTVYRLMAILLCIAKLVTSVFLMSTGDSQWAILSNGTLVSRDTWDVLEEVNSGILLEVKPSILGAVTNIITALMMFYGIVTNKPKWLYPALMNAMASLLFDCISAFFYSVMDDVVRENVVYPRFITIFSVVIVGQVILVHGTMRFLRAIRTVRTQNK